MVPRRHARWDVSGHPRTQHTSQSSALVARFDQFSAQAGDGLRVAHPGHLGVALCDVCLLHLGEARPMQPDDRRFVLPQGGLLPLAGRPELAQLEAKPELVGTGACLRPRHSCRTRLVVLHGGLDKLCVVPVPGFFKQ